MLERKKMKKGRGGVTSNVGEEEDEGRGGAVSDAGEEEAGEGDEGMVARSE